MRTRCLVAVGGLAAAGHALACCAVGMGNLPVHFAGQTNLVVWDRQHGMEHFVRNATFKSEGESLGFLAPSPSRPELSEVDPVVFGALAQLNPTRTKGMELATGAMAADAVDVVEVKDVAGYRATVLKANDARALREWLEANKYSAAPWLEGWLTPYVAKGWYITAFRVLGRGKDAETGAVRMSFRTDRPFNPYFVPRANRGDSPLSLYYVSAGREVPMLAGRRWQAPEWTAPVDPVTRHRVAEALKLELGALPDQATASYYYDASFSKPAPDDLFFEAPGFPESVMPRASFVMPGEGLVVGTGLVAGLFGAAWAISSQRRARRRRA